MLQSLVVPVSVCVYVCVGDGGDVTRVCDGHTRQIKASSSSHSNLSNHMLCPVWTSLHLGV